MRVFTDNLFVELLIKKNFVRNLSNMHMLTFQRSEWIRRDVSTIGRYKNFFLLLHVKLLQHEKMLTKILIFFWNNFSNSKFLNIRESTEI